MGFISLEPITIQKLVCNHPKVKYIWEYGGLSAIPNNGEAKRYIGIILEWDNNNKKVERLEFEDDGNGKAIEDAEKFLSELK